MKTLLILIALLPFAAHADVKHTDQHGFIVENVMQTPQTPDVVWHALIDDVDLWWPKDHSWWMGTFSIDANAGGCFCERKDNKSAEHMRIVFVDPNQTLRMSGGLGPLQGMGMNGALDWQLTETPTGTQVTLTYKVHGVNAEGFEKLAPIVAHVQGLQLNGLKDFLNK
ncbi:SRPBCC family protein [Alteromonas facilis]|uniref:SRPBCC family protein n=1 Tax=Alteromonas facilis TaxID=2048004 RepID=UPI000C283FC8|nr:SRPBCC domain-containing protein [Alteromonas facilis]